MASEQQHPSLEQHYEVLNRITVLEGTIEVLKVSAEKDIVMLQKQSDENRQTLRKVAWVLITLILSAAGQFLLKGGAA